MHRATPIRERNEAPQANCFGFCTCAPSVGRASATSLLSADTRHQVGRARICTFHSYLNFNPFNRYAPTPAISFGFCRCKTPGRYSSSKADVWNLPVQASLLPSLRASASSVSQRYLLPAPVSPARAFFASREESRGHSLFSTGKTYLHFPQSFAHSGSFRKFQPTRFHMFGNSGGGGPLQRIERHNPGIACLPSSRSDSSSVTIPLRANHDPAPRLLTSRRSLPAGFLAGGA